LLTLAENFKIPVLKVPVEKLNRVTRKNHQGAIAYISPIQYSSVEHMVSTAYERGELPFVLILDRITDVRNFGAIARTAECAGVHGIIIPSRGSALITSDAVKTSAGALNFIPVARCENLKTEIKSLQENGIYVVACTEKTEDSLFSLDLNRPVALIVGAEEDGISSAYLDIADAKGKLPMTGNIGSLNVSVATGVAIYEAQRQRL
jgi:23S rRNA (guanosine2251-2'-O)-methyltransferase